MISKSPFLVTRQVSPKLSLLLRQGYWAADRDKIFGKIPTQTPYLSHSVVEFATFNRLSLCRVSGFAWYYEGFLVLAFFYSVLFLNGFVLDCYR